jgi:uncharacterized membrane protein
MDRQGTIMGVPYDFRKPTWARMKDRMWNPGDERIVTPRTSGVGWTLNLYQLKKRYPPLFYLLVAALVAGVSWRAYRFFTEEDGD